MALGDKFSFDITADVRSAVRALNDTKAEADKLRKSIDGIKEVDVDADTSAAERDLRDLDDEVDELKRNLRSVVDRDWNINIDADRSAARTAEDVRRMGVNAEGVQRGIGPLRGFTDELGGASAAGGTAANAIIDLGEAVEIFGGQFGLSQAALSKWSLALGGIGIAAGVAIPLIAALANSQNDVNEATKAANDRLREQTGLLEQIEERLESQPSIVSALLPEDDQDGIVRAFGSLGFGIDELDRALIAANISGREFVAQRLEIAGASSGEADRIAAAIAEYGDYGAALLDARVAGSEFARSNEDLLRSLVDVYNVANDIDEEQLLSDFLADVRLFGTAEQVDAVTAALNRLGDAAPAQRLAAAFEAYETAADGAVSATGLLREELDELKAAADPTWTQFLADQAEVNALLDGAPGSFADMAAAASSAASSVDETTGALEGLLGTYDLLTARINEERQLIGLTEQYQATLAAFGELTAANAIGTEDATDEAAKYRKELLKLADDVVNYGRAFEDIPPEKVTRLYTAINEGDLETTRVLLADLTADRDIRIRLQVDDPGPVKFLIDPNTGAPTIISGAANPTVTTQAPTVATPPPAFTLDDLTRAIGGGSTTTNVNNYYTIGQNAEETARQARQYEFGGGRAG